MKNGDTQLAYKPEHAVDLETGVLLAAEVHLADEADPQTGPDTLLSAVENVEIVTGDLPTEDVVLDNGNKVTRFSWEAVDKADDLKTAARI